jgi:drug/metabolite transporter (DMT)-like permease
MKPKTLSLFRVNSAVFLWGLTMMFPKGIAMSPQAIVFFRSLVSVAALAIFLKATGGRLGVKRPRDYWLMAVLGLLLCVHWVTLFTALQLAEAAIVVVALNTYPALITLVEPLAYGRLPRRMDVFLATVVLGGVLIMLPEVSLTNQVTLAIALVVGSGALFAMRNIFIRKYASHYTGSTLMFWQTLVAFLCMLPFVPTTAEVYTARAVGLLVALGVVFTALPQSLYASGLRHLSAKTV